MHTAQQIKTAHTKVNSVDGSETYDHNGIYEECEMRGNVDQNWEEESTKYTFPDGSVLISRAGEYSIYAMDS